MNKSDLINEVAKVVSTKKDAQAAVNSMFEAIANALIAKDAVTIVGFGTFKVNERAARKGRNPQTGKEISIEGKTVAKFIPGKALKDAINN